MGFLQCVNNYDVEWDMIICLGYISYIVGMDYCIFLKKENIKWFYIIWCLYNIFYFNNDLSFNESNMCLFYMLIYNGRSELGFEWSNCVIDFLFLFFFIDEIFLLVKIY